MPQFAANLSTLYREHGFLERFAAARADGFDAVECQFPYEHAAADLAARLRDAGQRMVLVNAPAGDMAAGERGLACLPGREAAFRDSVERALALAHTLGCPRVHVLAGRVPAGCERAALQGVVAARLQWAAERAATAGVDVMIEPINLRDMPGYFLNRQDHAHEIVEAVGAPNLKVQMDLYHCQIVEGDVATKLRRYLPTGRVGHLQVAGVPDRQEPDIGELNAAYLFGVIDDVSAACGWQGWVGCEYMPRGATSAGLARWRRVTPSRAAAREAAAPPGPPAR